MTGIYPAPCMKTPLKSRDRNRRSMLARTRGRVSRTSDIHERLLPRGVGHGLKNLPLVPIGPGMFQDSLV